MAIGTPSGIRDILFPLLLTCIQFLFQAGGFRLLKVVWTVWLNWIAWNRNVFDNSTVYLHLVLIDLIFCWLLFWHFVFLSSFFISVTEHRDRSLFLTTQRCLVSHEGRYLCLHYGIFSISLISQFVPTSMKMISFFRFLTEMGVITENVFFK